MLSYLRILRPVNGLMAAFAVFIAMYIGGVAYNAIIVLPLISVFLISGAGMIINDYFDVDIDKINAPGRPLPCGKIAPRTALLYSMVLFIMGNTVALFISIPVFLLAFFNTLIEIFYSYRLKSKLFIKNITVSWLVASLFLFGGLVAKNILPLLILTILAFLSNTAREIFKDGKDIEGDKKQNIKTMATEWGKRKAHWAGCVFLILAIIFSVLPYTYNILNATYMVVVGVADIVFILSMLIKNKSVILSKMGMIIALVAFLMGSL